jgi:hypothetical protein
MRDIAKALAWLWGIVASRRSAAPRIFPRPQPFQPLAWKSPLRQARMDEARAERNEHERRIAAAGEIA